MLGGLLDHGGDFDIEINHADTGGVSDHNFGITYLLGYRFAPRIRNLRDRRLYTFKTITTYPTLRPIIDGRINIRLLRETWDDLLRFAASLQNGSIDAATALKRLAAYPEQNRIASALRELGRIVRTLFTIDWILDPGLRRQATEELNKGEGRNNLARGLSSPPR
ncbi:MAG: Tn3 family transposase [Geminicoccaceae bacterium]|nr:Tn3 family transposase [Geminicoccaceae bacterium]